MKQYGLSRITRDYWGLLRIAKAHYGLLGITIMRITENDTMPHLLALEGSCSWSEGLAHGTHGLSAYERLVLVDPGAIQRPVP